MTRVLRLDPSDTVAHTRAEFVSLWPGMTLNMFRAEVGFYKDWTDEPYRLGPDDVICARLVPDASSPLEIRGDMTEAQMRDAFYRALGIEVYVNAEQMNFGETLDAAAARLA